MSYQTKRSTLIKVFNTITYIILVNTLVWWLIRNKDRTFLIFYPYPHRSNYFSIEHTIYKEIWTLLTALMGSYVVHSFRGEEKPLVEDVVGWRFAALIVNMIVIVNLSTFMTSIPVFILSILLCALSTHILYRIARDGSTLHSHFDIVAVYIPMSLIQAFSIILVIFFGFMTFGKNNTPFAVLAIILFIFLAALPMFYAFCFGNPFINISAACMFAWTLFSIAQEYRMPAVIRITALGCSGVLCLWVALNVAWWYWKSGEGGIALSGSNQMESLAPPATN